MALIEPLITQSEPYSWPHYLVPVGIIIFAIFLIYLLNKGKSPTLCPQEVKRDILGLSIGYAGVLFQWHLFARQFGL